MLAAAALLPRRVEATLRLGAMLREVTDRAILNFWSSLVADEAIGTSCVAAADAPEMARPRTQRATGRILIALDWLAEAEKSVQFGNFLNLAVD